ncbi:MAG TPA: hypothetical protein VFK13_06125 [Gemmatimonadaceae bacterium]|nr:hypothetical protein [Gemmatimonadaceae bacterium]
MSLVLTALIGLLVGTHIATWGMYKDSIHEGFTVSTYLRSPVVAVVIAIIVHFVTGIDATRASGMVVLFGLIYVLERATVEFYKVFLRDEDQSKYFIPMQFHINGRVIHNRPVRTAIAIAYAGVVLLVVYGIWLLQRANHGLPNIALVLIVGSVGGWISAFGGAWKDAPIEGFETFKFFRSPFIALTYALLLSLFTHSLVVVTMGALGYTVATIETYKTFFFPSKPRGKFAGKPILFPDMLQRRQKFIPVYSGIWAILIVVWVIAFLQPHDGLLSL